MPFVAAICSLIFGIILYSFFFSLILKKKIRSLLRAVLCIIGGLIALPVVLYLAVLLCNLKDDDLRPEVKRLIEEHPPQMAANENGYFAWIGIMGPADQPSHDWGYLWFQAVTDRERDMGVCGSFGNIPIQAEVRQERISESEFVCKEIESCLEEVTAAPEATRKLLEQHQTTLD